MGVHDALAAVEHQLGAGVVGEFRDLAHRQDGAEHVGNVGDGDQFGLRPDHLGEFSDVDAAVQGHGGNTQHAARQIAQQLPRHDVGMVLHRREHDLVAFLQELAAPGGGDKVDGLGGALGKDDFFDRTRIDEGAHLLARGFVSHGGRFAEVIGPAMHVGVLVAIGAADGVDHLLGLLRRRRAVEIDQRLAVDLARQDREVGADFLDVERKRLGHLLVHTARLAVRRPPNTSRTASSVISATASARKPSTNNARAVSGSIPRAAR